MTKTTEISWTDFTVNFWEGCQKVGPGCDNCYAEARNVRFHKGQHWGPHAPRRKVKAGVPKLRKINRDAETFKAEHGHWPRVFCSSLSDVFDNAVDAAWRHEALKEIEQAPRVNVILLTKRISNVFSMVPFGWALGKWPQHVGLMITVVNQAEANRDIPKLLELKAHLGIEWVGLSIEPMLGPIYLTNIQGGKGYWECNALTGEVTDMCRPCPSVQKVDWVICGGESGRNARPMHPDWARGLRDQCIAAGTAFHFKQWGMYLPSDQACPSLLDGSPIDSIDQWDWADADERGALYHWDDGTMSIHLKKQQAGRLLDGQTWDQFPEALT